MSNFNIHHLEKLLEARPDVVPVGELVLYILSFCELIISMHCIRISHDSCTPCHMIAALHIFPVNQIEVHPFCTNEELVAYCKSRDIVVQAYCPLTRGEKLNDPRLLKMAKQ